jgi:hypothetical protein
VKTILKNHHVVTTTIVIVLFVAQQKPPWRGNVRSKTATMHRRLIRVIDNNVFEATSPQPSALESPMCGTILHKTGSAIQKADLVK